MDEGDVVEEKGGRKTFAVAEERADARKGFSGCDPVRG